MKKITALIFIFLFSMSFFAAKSAQAAQFSQALVRLDRNKPTTSLSGTVCVKPSAAAAGTENKISITFPNDFNISSNTSNWNTDISNLPENSTAWPGIGANASGVSGKTVTFTSGDLSSGSTLYCFNFDSSLSKTGNTGNKDGTITTKNSSNSTIDSSDYGLSIVNSDQITVNAVVAADPLDYSTNLSQVDPPPSNTTFPENFESEYQITYGTVLTYPSSITLQASWSQGTIENQSNPSIDILSYVSGSATNAFGNTIPVIDTINHTITWTIDSLPASTSGETVNFRLKTLENYTGTKNVTFTVSARSLFAGGSSIYSSLDRNYKHSIPSPGSSITTTPTPTPTANAKPVINNMYVAQITQDKAIIYAQTSSPTSKVIKYGTSINNLSANITSRLSSASNITLNNLSPKTKYYFRLFATDAKGNQVISDIYTFTTASQSEPLLVNPLTLIATSGNTIISNLTGDKNNLLVIPIESVFQFKFSTLNKISANSAQAIIRNNKILGAYSYIKKAEASTDSTNLLEVEQGVYSGNLQTTSTPGDYGLYIRIADRNGNITEQELAKIKVVNKFTVLSAKDKRPIEGARVLLYVYNPSTRTYQEIPSSLIDQGNPVFTDSVGQLDLVLPQGKYKAEISQFLYKDKLVEFEMNPRDSQGFPTVELENTGLSLAGLFNYYKRGLNDVFIFNTKAYSQSLTGSPRFFDLISLASLAALVLITLYAFSKRHRIPVSYIPTYFYYLIDRKSRNEKYIHGVIYDEDDKPIPDANVYLTDKHDEKIIANTKSNSRGEFFFKKSLSADRRSKSEYLLMAMARNYTTSPIFEYHEREHLKFKIILRKEEEGLNLYSKLIHYLTHFVGISFEVLLLGSFIFELLFLNSFGVARTLPFLSITIFNLALWILHIHNKSHSKVIF